MSTSNNHSFVPLPLRPTDLPDLRDEQLAWTRRFGPQLYVDSILGGLQLYYPDLPVEMAGKLMAEDEAKRLEESGLFHVSSDMTHLVRASSASLPDFTLHPSDLPTTSGLAVFEAPLKKINQENGTTAYVQAVTWGPLRHSVLNTDAISVTYYVTRDNFLGEAISIGRFTPDEANAYRQNMPYFLPDNDIVIPFSDTPLALDANQAGPERATDIAFMVKAMWMLMRQTLASVKDARFDRASRRRAQRAGREVPRVQVISLRRESSGDANDSSRQYVHQWIVRGHWRKQWYASVNDHRPVWIAPHIKGPEGAPLIGGERVYALRK